MVIYNKHKVFKSMWNLLLCLIVKYWKPLMSLTKLVIRCHPIVIFVDWEMYEGILWFSQILLISVNFNHNMDNIAVKPKILNSYCAIYERNISKLQKAAMRNLIGCRGVKLFLLKDVTITTFWVLSQFEFLNFVTIWVLSHIFFWGWQNCITTFFRELFFYNFFFKVVWSLRSLLSPMSLLSLLSLLSLMSLLSHR